MKKLLPTLLSATLLASSFTGAFAADITFTDVDKTTDFGKNVYKLVDAGIINGYEDGTFKAGDRLTRAEFCKMVNLTFGFTVASDNVFADVKNTDWFYTQVLYAINKGYIKGFEDNTFRGDDFISREQVCVILDRILSLTSDKEVTVSDEVSDWAQDSVKKMIANGYMPLEEGEKFRATEDITRGELVEALKFFVKEEAPKEEDKKDDTKNDDTKKDDNKGNSSSSGGSSGSSSGGSSSSGSSSDNSSDEDSKLPSLDDDNTSVTDPDPEPEPDPEPAKPTEEQIAASNKVCDELMELLAEIKMIDFEGEAATIIGYVQKDIEETVLAAYDENAEGDDKGVIITEQYVRTTYAEDIDAIKAVISSLDEMQKEEFKVQILQIRVDLLNTLATYFNINLEYFN